MAVKPERTAEYKEVNYTEARWALLHSFRTKAEKIMTALDVFHMYSVVHGSVARGDVNKDSDIDVFIAGAPNSFLVETALEKAGIPVNARMIVQATPTYGMKAHVKIDDQTTVTFPLMEMRKVEKEFYQFGGELSLPQLEKELRVPGVDKRLMLIEPKINGHVESSIMGREEITAKILGVSTETVLDRVRALTKRDRVGRTGVFLKKELSPDETFELALKRNAETNPAVRRRMKK